jgi:hypothetical protein
MVSASLRPPPARDPQLPMLWFAMLAGPIAWALQLQFEYVLAQLSCYGRMSDAALHWVSAACLAIAVLGFVASLHAMKSLTAAAEASLTRRYFMSLQGLMTSSLFALVIVAQWISVAMLSSCPLYEGL